MKRYEFHNPDGTVQIISHLPDDIAVADIQVPEGLTLVPPPDDPAPENPSTS